MTTATLSETKRIAEPHTCPRWVGYLLASPLRRLFDNPRKLLGPHVRSGDTVIDLGCAMGFFSLPLAKMVGPAGRVVCVDSQDYMLGPLCRKIRRRGLEGIMETRLCSDTSLQLEDLAGQADLAVAWHVVHEVPNRAAFFREAFEALRPGGRMLLSEPNGHVCEEDFRSEIALAKAAGFQVRSTRRDRRTSMAVLEKPTW